MKKYLLATTFILSSFIANYSQVGFNSLSTLNRPPVFGPSPFQDSLWAFDTLTFNRVYASAPTPSSGGVITGMNGFTMHPHTGQFYVICKQSGTSGRTLGTYNVFTGVVTIIGNLGSNFSTITFKNDGQLIGATGDGASPSETMFSIDPATAATTLLYAMGNGADGEVLSYNFEDSSFYHWSGNGTVVMEKMLATNLTYTPTNIPISGTTGGETFGSVYLGNGIFLNSTIASNFRKVTATGVYGGALGSLPDDIRGLGLVGRWVERPGSDTICANETSLFVASATMGGSGRHKFQWVLNGVNIPGATNDSLFANLTGFYNCRIILDSLNTNNQTMDSAITAYTDTAWYGRHLQVLNIPVVTINPTPIAYLCEAGDSIQLTGSSGGTSQWYQNGSMISGATTNTYYASTVGVYNMVKTNLNGCGDSSAIGTQVLFAPVSTMSPTGSSTVCNPAAFTLVATNGANQYQWLRNDTVIAGATNDSLDITTSGNYECIVTYGSCNDTVGSYQLTVIDCSGIEENSSVHFEIYPNPTHEKLNISSPSQTPIKSIEIIDLAGRKIRSINVNNINTIISVDELMGGAYLINIITEKGVISKRFIKY